MAVNDVYRCSVETLWGSGVDMVNVFHYRTDVVGTGDEIPALLDALEYEVGLVYPNVLPSSAAVRKLTVRGVTDLAVGGERDISIAGAGAGEAVPPQSAAVVSWRTGLVGRSYRGRTYLPAPIEGNQADGVMLAGYKSAVETLANAMIEIGGGSSPTDYEFKLGIYSRVLLQFNDVTTFVVRSQIRTMRSRAL